MGWWWPMGRVSGDGPQRTPSLNRHRSLTTGLVRPWAAQGGTTYFPKLLNVKNCGCTVSRGFPTGHGLFSVNREDMVFELVMQDAQHQTPSASPDGKGSLASEGDGAHLQSPGGGRSYRLAPLRSSWLWGRGGQLVWPTPCLSCGSRGPECRPTILSPRAQVPGGVPCSPGE